MSEEKLTPTRLVFVPFLITSILFISIYSFVHWLLLLKFGTFETERSTEFYLPIVLATILVVLIISPRLKLLNLKNEKRLHSDSHFFYGLMAVFAIAFSTISLQGFIQDSMGELTELNQIQDIHNKRATKYYSLKKQHYIAYNRLGIYTSKEVYDSRHSYRDKLRFKMFIVAPILTSASDTSLERYEAWIGNSYTNEIYNDESEAFKVEAFDKFYQANIEHFLGDSEADFSFFERIVDDKEYFERAARSTLKAKYPALIFDAHYGPFQKRTEGGIILFIIVLIVSTGLMFLLIHNKPFEQKELNRFLKIPENPDDASLINNGYKWKRRQKRSS